jgi:hypothetical protein
LIRGAVDPPLSGHSDWDLIAQKCDVCHNNKRSPGFDVDAAMKETACPPMRPDDPDLAKARRRVLKAIERNRAEGTSSPRDVYREGRALVGLGRVNEGVELIVEYATTIIDQNAPTVEICRYLDDCRASQAAVGLIKAFLAQTPSDPMANTEYVRLLLEASDETVHDARVAESHIRLVAPDDGEEIKFAMVPIRMLQVDALFRTGKGAEAFRLLQRLNVTFPRNDEVSEFVDRWVAEKG